MSLWMSVLLFSPKLANFETLLRDNLRSSQVLWVHRQFLAITCYKLDREAKVAPLCLSCQDTSTAVQYDIPVTWVIM